MKADPRHAESGIESQTSPALLYSTAPRRAHPTAPTASFRWRVGPVRRQVSADPSFQLVDPEEEVRTGDEAPAKATLEMVGGASEDCNLLKSGLHVGL